MQLVSEAEEKLASIAKDKAKYKSLLTDLLVQVRGAALPYVGTCQHKALLTGLLGALTHSSKHRALYKALLANPPGAGGCIVHQDRWVCGCLAYQLPGTGLSIGTCSLGW